MSESLSKQITRLNRKIEAIVNDETKASHVRAANRTIEHAASKLKKSISARADVQQKLISERIFLGKATFRKLRARVTVYRRGISVINMMTQGEITRARRVTRLKSGRTKRYGVKARSHVFPKGFVGVSRKNRKLHAWERKTSKRYPIRRLSVDISNTVDEETIKEIERSMEQVYPKVLAQEFNFRTTKYANKRTG
ncbi:phage tail protein [Hahella ganghwensis]|uniref:phage tail protein n=1 Tax=Hahella ganghwensis TaxID=286420 RepID=UPI000363F65C|nr:phage tail protein [Hahella ganghwensis]